MSGALVVITAGAVALREELSRRGLSQNKLAADLGQSSGIVSRWCNGLRQPPLAMILRMRDLLGIPVDSWAVEVERRRVHTEAA